MRMLDSKLTSLESATATKVVLVAKLRYGLQERFYTSHTTLLEATA